MSIKNFTIALFLCISLFLIIRFITVFTLQVVKTAKGEDTRFITKITQGDGFYIALSLSLLYYISEI